MNRDSAEQPSAGQDSRSISTMNRYGSFLRSSLFVLLTLVCAKEADAKVPKPDDSSYKTKSAGRVKQADSDNGSISFDEYLVQRAQLAQLSFVPLSHQGLQAKNILRMPWGGFKSQIEEDEYR